MIAALGAFGLKALGLLKLVPVWAWVMFGLAMVISVLVIRLDRVKVDLVSTRADLVVAQTDARAAYARIATQNAAVLQMKADGAAREARLSADLVKAAPVAARHHAKAEALAVYTPKGADALAQLVDLDAEIAR